MPKGRFYNVQPTPENFRAIWDLLHSLRDDLDSAQATNKTLTTTISGLQPQIDTAMRLAKAGQVSSTQSAPIAPIPGPQPVTDNGQGSAGCDSAPSTGHVSGQATPFILGQIVCGTANEFPALFAVVGDQPTRDNNRFTFIGRAIWHINLNGTFGGASRYPGNVFDILVNIGSVQYAYRVTGYEPFGQPMTHVMVFGGATPGATTVPDPGISD